MPFKIDNYKGNTFIAEFATEGSDTAVEFELLALSYFRWNEIGLTVTQKTAPRKPDPDNRGKYIADDKMQIDLDSEAEMSRNAMRIVVALEGGEGIDWGDFEPDTLAEKAAIMMDIDAAMFINLLAVLTQRVYGMKVSTKDSESRFSVIQSNSNEGRASVKDNDLAV
jgi:hypothetical protein